MNTAFGAGNWQRLTFSNAVSTGIFTPGTYDFLYFDGGDGQAGGFNNFVNTNRTALEAWVSGGGSLFLNAARTSSPLDLGFGATLNYTPRPYARALDSTHPIFNGPNGPTGTQWTGSAFSHDYVTGAGLTPLIVNDVGRSVLVERSWGQGHVLLGGMTNNSFHRPAIAAANLRANILDYGAAQAHATVVPAPPAAVLALCGGMPLLAWGWWRRRGVAAIAATG